MKHFKPIFLGTIVYLAMALFGWSASATIIYVDIDASSGNNDGTSWTDAYTQLQTAMDNAAAGDTLWVAAGTYLPTDIADGHAQTDARYRVFHIANKDIKILGGFAGNETSVSQRDWTANPTILSGDINGDDVITGSGATLSITNNTENNFKVLITAGLTSAFELNGFTITGACNTNIFGISFNYAGQSFDSIRGGICNSSSSPSFINVTIDGNQAYDGGGMYIRYSSPAFTNVTFSRNYAESEGGGVYNIDSSPTFTNVTFFGNHSEVDGGGMNNLDASATLTNVTFFGNNAPMGGAMFNFGSSEIIALKNALFFGNTANSAGLFGIQNDFFFGTLNISNSLLQEDPTTDFSGTLNASNNLTFGTDPLFVNAADPDGPDNIWMTADDGLALQAGSPCLSQGIEAGAPPIDITGATRPNPPSIGAYETVCIATAGTFTHSACGSYTWIDGNTYTASNSSATHTLTNAAGCDSVVTLDLTINSPSSGTFTHSACDSYTWIDGTTYTASNSTATHTLTNAAGCDSVVTLDLTINNASSGTFTHSACDSYTWIDGNTYTSSNSTATHTLTNAAGCDSVITLNLTINSVSDLTTSTSGVTIAANNSNATYQWLNCDSSFAAISNQVAASYTATVNGNYAVVLTENGCVDTTDCVTISSVGIQSNAFANAVSVYPNPVNDLVYIESGSTTIGRVALLDPTGRMILQRNVRQNVESITLSDLPQGIYVLRLTSKDGEHATVRLIKN